jgi:hypothetical protein
VHTPRSTLSSWGGAGGAALEPLYDAHKRFILSAAVLHGDETPVPLLDPGKGKTARAYIWAYARGELDPHQGVIYEFCTGRGAHFPLAFLGGQGPPYAEAAWQGTLVCDQYAGYGALLDARAFPHRHAVNAGQDPTLFAGEAAVLSEFCMACGGPGQGRAQPGEANP